MGLYSVLAIVHALAGATWLGTMVSSALERQILYGVHPLLEIGRPGDQFQILDELPDRAPELMTEEEAGERPPLPLPLFRERLEPNVLGENEATEFVGMLQQIRVVAFRPAIFDGGEHVDAAAPQLIRD